MTRRIIATAIGIVVAVGAALWYNSVRAPEVLDQDSLERELKEDGVMDEDGTLKADTEFDAELNALTKELNATDSEGSTELDAIGAVQ